MADGTSWANDYLKAVGNSNAGTSKALTSSAGIPPVYMGHDTPPAPTLYGGNQDAANTILVLGLKKSGEQISTAGYQTYDKASDKFVTTSSLKDDLAAAKAYLTELEKAQEKIQEGLTTADNLTWTSNSAKTTVVSQLNADSRSLDAKRVKYVAIIDDLQSQINAKNANVVVPVAPPVTSTVAVPVETPPPAINQNISPTATPPSEGQAGAWDTGVNGTARTTISKPKSGLELTYNVGSVRDAYFSTAKDYLKETTYRGNNPSLVTRAAALFKSAGNSKGMFVMTNPLPNKVIPTGNAGESAGWSAEAAWVKWGFQFLYNPATVNMTYQIGPAVDIGYLASGQEGANYTGTDGSFSTISFELIINRMPDMKYYQKSGLLTAAGKEQYGDHIPTAKDQIDIYTKGTMYDLEYLLRTASSGTLIQNTWLRGTTADLGYLGAQPIELHLGKNLRYWGTISSLEVNHTIFNEKMVPVFTSVSLTFSRLVEPPKKPKGR